MVGKIFNVQNIMFYAEPNNFTIFWYTTSFKIVCFRC